ncbi:putative 26S proteasome non-ATPase regulatory subunit [Chytridium lagenaria]|nr:putative 26S proteasome non-ATPase regulatory subunit [Chytridium lagenaria]
MTLLGATASIFSAAYDGNLDTVRTLLAENPQMVTSKDEDQRTALHWAASGKRTLVAAELIEKGAAVNALDDANWSPLMIAASVGCAPIVDLLLQNGADANLKNETLQSPLFYAASKGWIDVCQLLLKHGANVNARDQIKQVIRLSIARAAAKGNTAIIKMLLEQPKVDIDAEDRSGNTPLHMAVDMGNGESALTLIQAGADVTIVNKDEQTPLDMGQDKNVREFLRRAVANVSR